MKNGIGLLRISYWTGAVVDAKAALLLIFPNLFPELFYAVFGVQARDIESSNQPIRLLAAILVLAWTCLLLWADRKPIERKGVLALTVFPVLFGILSIRIYMIFVNNLSIYYLEFTILMIILLILFIYSYCINTPNIFKTFFRTKDSNN